MTFTKIVNSYVVHSDPSGYTCYIIMQNYARILLQVNLEVDGVQKLRYGTLRSGFMPLSPGGCTPWYMLDRTRPYMP